MRGDQPWATNRSRVLRANATTCEGRLWARLRNRQLGGFKFVRQASIGGYFADFACRECKLIVEVDGATHGEPAELAEDERRTAVLRDLGFRVLRFTNADVIENMTGVLDSILRELER